MSYLGRRLLNEIGSVIYEPGHNIVGYRAVINSLAYSTGEFYGKLVRVISAIGGSLRLVKVYRSADSGEVGVVVFVEVKGGKEQVKGLLERLRSDPAFKDVEFLEPVRRGFLVDPRSFPPLFMGQRAVILSRSAYDTFLRRLREKYGAGYSAMLYHIGLNMGYHAYEDHARLVGDDIRTLIRTASALFAALGFGVIEVTKFRMDNAVVRVYDSFECELFKQSNTSSSHFIRGLIAGWLAAAWKTDTENVTCIERKCVAMGDEYCEFHAMKVKRSEIHVKEI